MNGPFWDLSTLCNKWSVNTPGPQRKRLNPELLARCISSHKSSSDRGEPLLGLAGQDDTVVLGLEPLHGVLLVQTVGEPDLADLRTRTG